MNNLETMFKKSLAKIDKEKAKASSIAKAKIEAKAKERYLSELKEDGKTIGTCRHCGIKDSEVFELTDCCIPCAW
jgi:hypothetical protein